MKKQHTSLFVEQIAKHGDLVRQWFHPADDSEWQELGFGVIKNSLAVYSRGMAGRLSNAQAIDLPQIAEDDG